MTANAPPSELQLQLMAYVDDELTQAKRVEFETAMARDPELAREVIKMQNLMDLSRSLAMSEPTDMEMRRFWSKFYNRTEWRVGWLLLAAGVVVLLAEGLYLLISTDLLSWLHKGAILSTLTGGALLLWNTLRLKLRTTHFDRYRGVTR